MLIIRDATGGAVTPVQVWVDYAPPSDQSALTQRFGPQLRFLRGCRALVFDAADLATPLVQSEPRLCAILDEHARRELAALPAVGTFADRVRDQLASQLAGGDPTAQGTARALRMSVRTLHRKLSHGRTTHKRLLGQLRTQLAHTYLRDRAIAIAEVAYLLGFSEPSAFHRAFRRWTGQTPAQFRANI